MITKLPLPEGFQSYNIMRLCSNTLIGGAHILSVGDVLPLVIGVGSKPLIWMQAISDVKKKNFISIVESSIPQLSTVRVTVESGALVVTVKGHKVLSVREINKEEIDIFQMDLRPIGFNIFGDQEKLQAGGMQLSKNTFSGGGTFMGFTLE